MAIGWEEETNWWTKYFDNPKLAKEELTEEEYKNGIEEYNKMFPEKANEIYNFEKTIK